MRNRAGARKKQHNGGNDCCPPSDCWMRMPRLMCEWLHGIPLADKAIAVSAKNQLAICYRSNLAVATSLFRLHAIDIVNHRKNSYPGERVTGEIGRVEIDEASSPNRHLTRTMGQHFPPAINDVV